MRYAYLVIAHNEFEILTRLINCLDDTRNDIFLHIDKKVKILPDLKTNRARVFLLEQRTDTRWGDVSQVETEYSLFKYAASIGAYDRYIMISGVHLPLKSQEFIHQWFDERKDYEILAPVPSNSFQEDQKMHRYNLFTRCFSRSKCAQKLWNVAMTIQRKVGIRRNTSICYSISSNWVCLTDTAVRCLLDHKKEVMREWKYTFCGDEFFVRSILERYGFGDRILLTDQILYCDFGGKSSPRTLTEKDYEQLQQTDYLFARKFSAKYNRNE